VRDARVRRFLSWSLGAVAAIVLLVIVAAASLPWILDTPRVQSYVASSASHALGRPVTFSAMSVSVFPLPSVVLSNLEVKDDPRFGTAPFLRLERGELRLKLVPLLAGHVQFGTLVLRKPVVTVVQDAQGRWNFASLGTTTTAGGEPRATPRQRQRSGSTGTVTAPPVSSVKLEDGVVTYVSRGRGPLARHYRLEDVDLTLNGEPRAIALKGSVRVVPGDLEIGIDDTTIALNPSQAVTEGALRGRVNLRGSQIRDLVAVAAGPSPAVAGTVKGTLTLGGSVGDPRASGDVTLSDLAVTHTNPRCPAPQERTLRLEPLTLNVAWEDGHLTARPLRTGVGGGTVTTNLVATVERGTHLELRELAVRQVGLDKVLVDFLCQGYAVTGALDLTGVLTLDPREPMTTLGGSGELRIGPGKVVGPQAQQLFGGVTRLGGAVPSLGSSPLEFESITGSFEIARGVVTTRDLLYTSRAIRAVTAGEYALASGQVNLDVIVTHARGELQAKVTGTAGSPSIRLLPSSVVRGVDPSRVQGGLQELLRRFR
jgi:uncharacterized protein involved in outer membrane biogenesis